MVWDGKVVRQRPLWPPKRHEDGSHWSYEGLRWKVFVVLDVPGNSWLGMLTTAFLIACILGSVGCYIVASYPRMHEHTSLWWALEVMFVTTFTAEYILRFWATRDSKCTFLRDGFNMCDLIAIVPFYAEMIIYMVLTPEQETWIPLFLVRALRMMRLFRLFKIARYSDSMRLVGAALGRSAESLGLLAFMLIVALIMFGSLMYFVEGGVWSAAKGCGVRPSDGKCSPFESIPSSWYWGTATLTTVGYGDDIPHTTAGQLISMATMVVGVMVIALPVTIIGNDFVGAYNDVGKERVQRQRVFEIAAGPQSHAELYGVVKDFQDLNAEADLVITRIRQALAAHLMMSGRAQDISHALRKFEPQYDLFHRGLKGGLDDVHLVMRKTCPDYVA